MRIRLIDEVKYLIKRLNGAGFRAWAVGGCVRDGILGRTIHDWDVCTGATPENMMAVLAGERIVPTGIKHGTLTVIIGAVPIETTTLRADGDYADHRRPKFVRFVDELSLDLARRDFTVNAMAYNDSDGLIDPFKGLEDLNNAVIRCVGKPRERFSEDALRILRAVRFASQLDFSIDRDTVEAARDMRNDLSFVSRERVLSETVKLLRGEAAARAVRENADVVSAALSVAEIDLGWRSFPRDAAIGLVLLLGEKAPGAAKALRADNELMSRIEGLCALLKYPVTRTETEALSLLREARRDAAAFDLAEYWKCRGLEFDEKLLLNAALKCHSVRDLAINGDDLLKMGLSGKTIGRALEKLLSAVINGEVQNDRAELSLKAIDISENL